LITKRTEIPHSTLEKQGDVDSHVSGTPQTGSRDQATQLHLYSVAPPLEDFKRNWTLTNLRPMTTSGLLKYIHDAAKNDPQQHTNNDVTLRISQQGY